MMKYIILGGIAAGIAIGSISYVTAYNKGNRLENNIVAQYNQNKNSLSKLSLAVMEAAKVPKMARDDLQKVIEAAMEGRYGENGSQAYVQAITEAYPGTIDPSLYSRIQNLIEAGRTDFAKEQELLIDKVRIYKTELGTFWGGTWMSIAGYPKINLADYKIVISGHVDKSFENGLDEGINF